MASKFTGNADILRDDGCTFKVTEEKKKRKQKWRWPVISLTGLVPTTGTFVHVDLPGNKYLEWN